MIAVCCYSCWLENTLISFLRQGNLTCFIFVCGFTKGVGYV